MPIYLRVQNIKVLLKSVKMSGTHSKTLCRKSTAKSEEVDKDYEQESESESESETETESDSCAESDSDFKLTSGSEYNSGSDQNGENESVKDAQTEIENASESEDDKTVYKCKLCPYKTTKSWLIHSHNIVHTGKKPYVCKYPGCGFRTAYSGSLKWHKKRHENKRELKCPHCSYGANCMNSYKAHMVIHTKERNYACPLCDHRTTQKSHLIVHLRKHTGEKPYKCSSCPYAAADKRNLKSHELIHSNSKPFACNLCSYKSRQKSHLNEHMRRHLNEKSFQCPYCLYTAVCKTMLTTHVDTHLDDKDKRRQCPVSGCKYAAAQTTPWKIHLETHHGLNAKKIAAKLKMKPEISIRKNKKFQPTVRPARRFKMYKCPQEKCKFGTNRFDLHAAHLNVHKLPRVLLKRI